MQATHVLHARPPTSLGTLGKVPLEIRSEIYDYMLSPNCYNMTRDLKASPTSPNYLNILSTAQALRSEALDDLASKTFTLGCYIPHERSIFLKNGKVDIPNATLRNAIKRMRNIQVMLDAPYLCEYVDRQSYEYVSEIPSTAFDWPSIAQTDRAPATDLLLARPNILAGAAENFHGRNTTIVLHGSYREFRYPVTEQGEQAFKNLVAMFQNFETLKLRAEATVNVPPGSPSYEYLSDKKQAKAARTMRQYMKVLVKKIKDIVGSDEWTEERSEESGGKVLRSGTAEFHPSAHSAATRLRSQNVEKNQQAQKAKTCAQ